MKKLILLIFLLSFSNAEAVTSNVFDFKSSFDIGNYMADNYTRWICENYQCKETNKKTEGDFGTKSECEKACKKNISNTSLNTNQEFFTSFKPTTSKPNYQSYTQSDLFDYSNDNLLDYTIDTNKSPTDYLSFGTIDNFQNNFVNTTPKKDVTSVIGGINFDTSLTKPEVKTSTSPINNFFESILKGFGFDKTTTSDNVDSNQLSKVIDDNEPQPPSLPDGSDYIWYGKEYGYKITNSNPSEIKNIDNWKLELIVELKIRRPVSEEYYDIGVLYSYINNENKRVFDSFSDGVWISKPKNDSDKYFYHTLFKEIDIPNDIKISNNQGLIEAIAVIKPNYYFHFTSSENDYAVWKATDKSNIYFNYENTSFDRNLLKSNCSFSIVDPQPKSNFIDGKDPYYTNFKLAVKMNCSIPLTHSKFKIIPEHIYISYKMDCPNHFNTDWQTADNPNYKENFLNGIKEFKFDIDTQSLNFEKIFVLEDTTLMEILYGNSSTNSSNNDFFTKPQGRRSFGLSKRCDLDIKINTAEEDIPLTSLKDYFYLNQCYVRVINEHPEWTYCTENKNGEPLPIPGKVTFSCQRDIDYNMKDIEFAMYPDPYEEKSSIYDTKKYPHFFINNYDVNKELNGQTIYVDFNMYPVYFDRYFKDGYNLYKNQSKSYSKLTFSPLYYYVIEQELFYDIPNENKRDNQKFNIYYGSNYNCDNISSKDPSKPTEEKTNSNKSTNIFSIIGSFFKSLFK